MARVSFPYPVNGNDQLVTPHVPLTPFRFRAVFQPFPLMLARECVYVDMRVSTTGFMVKGLGPLLNDNDFCCTLYTPVSLRVSELEDNIFRSFYEAATSVDCYLPCVCLLAR